MWSSALFWSGAVAIAAGCAAVLIAWFAPAPPLRTVAAARSKLDAFAPHYQFSEFHSLEIDAPPDRVYRAIREVSANEIALFRTLTWIRRFGRSGPENILNVPERQPILDVATRTTFVRLAEVPDREVVVGTYVVAPPGAPVRDPATYAGIEDPGYARATMNFLVEPLGPARCRVTTETRIYATDRATARRFGRYWTMIYPGSSLIRYSWLRAIRRRAAG
jgi:hypothetical protein